MFPFGFENQNDPFGQGGITHQLDHHLRALQHATWIDDARLYANLVSQVAAILRPKLTADEYQNLRVHEPSEDASYRRLSRRDQRRCYERLLFRLAQDHLAELLRIASERGIYAKKDESAPEPADASNMAIK